jgi:hypothetical protein
MPDGVKQLMLIAPRMALEQRFAVFAVTDRQTGVLVSMTLSMRWQWATCQPSFANSLRVAKRLCYLFGLHLFSNFLSRASNSYTRRANMSTSSCQNSSFDSIREKKAGDKAPALNSLRLRTNPRQSERGWVRRVVWPQELLVPVLVVGKDQTRQWAASARPCLLAWQSNPLS